MKKISLKNLNLKEVEQLSREQLKNVLGGWTGGPDTEGGTQEETDVNIPCNCKTGESCSVSRVNNPTEEEVAAICERCCNP